MRHVLCDWQLPFAEAQHGQPRLRFLRAIPAGKPRTLAQAFLSMCRRRSRDGRRQAGRHSPPPRHCYAETSTDFPAKVAPPKLLPGQTVSGPSSVTAGSDRVPADVSGDRVQREWVSGAVPGPGGHPNAWRHRGLGRRPRQRPSLRSVGRPPALGGCACRPFHPVKPAVAPPRLLPGLPRRVS